MVETRRGRWIKTAKMGIENVGEGGRGEGKKRERWELEGRNKNERKSVIKERGGTRVEGQGEGEGVSLLGRWRGVFSFVLLRCVCVLTLTSRAELQH